MPSISDEFGINSIFEINASNQLREDRRNKKIISALPNIDQTILEIGCGLGELSFELAKNPKYQITALDQSKKFIDHLLSQKNKSSIQFIQSTAKDHLKTKENFYDAITGKGILHHIIPIDSDFYRTLYKSLKPNGTIHFIEPNYSNPFCLLIFKIQFMRKLFRLDEFEMPLKLSETKKALQSAGFFIEEIGHFDFFYPSTPVRLLPIILFLEKYFLAAWPFSNLAQSIYLRAKKIP